MAGKKKTKKQITRAKQRGQTRRAQEKRPVSAQRAPAFLRSDRPFISLAMMVKDEEEFLEASLRSVAPWVDEMIVVDTGSTDRTVEIAQDLGATVSFFEWPDDFSAARNETIERANGEWVLILDADERFHGDDPSRLRSSLTRRSTYPYLGYMVNVINIRLDGSEMNSLHSVRIFPNHEHMRYRNRVHNQLLPTVEPQPKMELVVVEGIHITHLGYDPTVYAARKKTERSLPLIEKVIEEEPDNLVYHFYRGRELCILKRYLEAVETLEFVAQKHLDGEKGYVEETFKTLFVCYEKLASAHPEDAKSYYEKMVLIAEGAIELAEEQPDFWYYHGLGAQQLGRLDTACDSFRRAVEAMDNFALHNTGQGNPLLLNHLWRALQKGGDIAWTLERYEDAYYFYRRCVAVKPVHTDGWALLLNSVCALAIEFNDEENLEGLLERLVRHLDAPLDMYFFKVERALAAGELEVTKGWLRWGHKRSSRLRRDPKFLQLIEALDLPELRPRR